MNKPSQEDGERCIALRVRSKRGEHLGVYDQRFVDRMWHEYPEWYAVTEARITHDDNGVGG